MDPQIASSTNLLHNNRAESLISMGNKMNTDEGTDLNHIFDPLRISSSSSHKMSSLERTSYALDNNTNKQQAFQNQKLNQINENPETNDDNNDNDDIQIIDRVSTENTNFFKKQRMFNEITEPSYQQNSFIKMNLNTYHPTKKAPILEDSKSAEREVMVLQKEVKQKRKYKFRFDLLQSDIISMILNYIPNAIQLNKLSRIFHGNIMPNYCIQTQQLNLQIPKIEQIPKQNKTIEDLLGWNREVSQILQFPWAILLDLTLVCQDFKIYNPLNEKLVNKERFPVLQRLKCGVFEDNFPKNIAESSILNSTTLNECNFVFGKMTTSAAEVLIKLFRSDDFSSYKPTSIRKLGFEYQAREREAILSIMSGILHQNPYLESLSLVATHPQVYLNVNNYIENFEDFIIGPRMTSLVVRDSMLYSDRTKFLEGGSENLVRLEVSKSILNQRNFRLDDSLKILKLNPINFAVDTFEINFDQFLFVIESLQQNTTLEVFEIGVRHGNLKKKIFNPQLYERERRNSTQRLSTALVKVFAHNKTLRELTIQYKHANFDECIKIGIHLLTARKQNFNRIQKFNGFPFTDYSRDMYGGMLKDLYIGEAHADLDKSDFDPLWSGLIVALILQADRMNSTYKSILFEPQPQALDQYSQRLERMRDIKQMQEMGSALPTSSLKYFERDLQSFTDALAQEHTTVIEPINQAQIATMRGMVKDELLRGTFLTKFDLGYIPKKLHMIFLFFLRANQHIRALHGRKINLKADIIRYLLKDFVNLKEFTLSFAQGSNTFQVGGGYSKVGTGVQFETTKRKEIGSLVVSILAHWKELEFLQLEQFQFNAAQFEDNQLYESLNSSKIKHILIKDAYVYNTRLFFQQRPAKNALQKSHEAAQVGKLAVNKQVESIVLMDFKLAYGMNMEVSIIARFENLKVFCVELNDLRGSDRGTFPKLVSDVTKSLSLLKNLECLELNQKSGHTSCVFDDNDIEPEMSIGWLRAFETMIQKNTNLQRLNIFFPLRLEDLQKFANLCLPKLLNSNLLSFYGINCLAVRNDMIDQDFLQDIYRCYEYEGNTAGVNSKNYKYKKGAPSILPLLILNIFRFIKVPDKLNFFKRTVQIDEEIEFQSTLDLSNYKQCLNSDISILIGLSLVKNPRLQTLLLVNLNLYDVDLQTLINSDTALSELRKLSFKRSTFMCKIKSIDKVLKSANKLVEVNFSMTNILAQLNAPQELFNVLEKLPQLQIVSIAALSQDNEDAKKMRQLIRSMNKCKRLFKLNISENYLTAACFHVLRDLFLRSNTVKVFKFYLASSDRLFNEMFLELQRFNEELIRRGNELKLAQYSLSKGNTMDFPQVIKQNSSVVYIGENKQLPDIVFQVEKARHHQDQIRTFVLSQARLGESKEFALYLNDFFKDCPLLESVFICRTNLGGLLRNAKNVNLFRDLRSTSLRVVNLTSCDLRNCLLERVALACRNIPTIERLVVVDNLELDLEGIHGLFRHKKIKIDVKVEESTILFPQI